MTPFRRAVLIVAVLNAGYFVVEFVVALGIGSVSLLADSVDFLEDTSINLLIFFAVAWTARSRARLGHVLALVILVPALAALVTAIAKVVNPVPPDPIPLSVTAFGALAVNLTCAVILVSHRHHAGTLTKAAWLSARNDALANVAVIGAAVVVAATQTAWADIVVGVGIGLLNADAARQVWLAASDEHLRDDEARA